MISRTRLTFELGLFLLCFCGSVVAGEQNINDEELLEGPPPQVENEEKNDPPSPEFSPPIPFPLKNKVVDGEESDTAMTREQTQKSGDVPDDPSDSKKGVSQSNVAAPTNAAATEAQQTVTAVSSGEHNSLGHGHVEIETDPENARVYISTEPGATGDEYGTTPLRVTLSPGNYYVTLVHDECDTAVAEVSVSAQKTSWLRLKMTAARSNVSKGIRLAGHLLFWPGIATSITGISLLLVNNSNKNANTSLSGGIAAGAGVAMTILGGIFLGVTHRDQSVYTIPLALSPLDDHGAQLSFSKTF